MPRPRKTVPKYSHHKPSGRAYVRVPDGLGRRRVIYLGQFGTPESRDNYALEIANLGKLEATTQAAAAVAAIQTLHASLNEVMVAFYDHAVSYYRRPDGTPTRELDEFKLVIGHVRRQFGEAAAIEFGPRKLKTVRDGFIAADWCRTVINQRVNRIRHIFKWAAAEELVPGSVWESLRAVEGLKVGRSAARERPRVLPVAEAAVRATLPFLRPPLRAMVEMQLLTGMRPGEVVRLKPAEVDASEPVWVYRPAHHKNSHREKNRAIAIGPRGQQILAAFTPCDSTAFYFSPRQSVEQYHAERFETRKTPHWPSHMRRNAVARAAAARKPRTKHSAKDRYSSGTYCRAIAKAVERANRSNVEAAVDLEYHVPHWHPNQLRHTHLTEVRRRFGLEAAQVAAGHARADVTQVYAEKNLALAVKVASEIG